MPDSATCYLQDLEKSTKTLHLNLLVSKMEMKIVFVAGDVMRIKRVNTCKAPRKNTCHIGSTPYVQALTLSSFP